VPPDNVRCTRTVQLRTRHPRVSLGVLRYNSPDCPVCHQTVRCTSGATAPSRKGRLQKLKNQMNSAQTVRDRAVVRGAPGSEQYPFDVAPDCPVPLEDKASNGRLCPNPNGWVTWLAHRTVWCVHRQQPNPNGCLVIEGYKYPSTTSTPTIQAFSTPHSIQEQIATLQDTNQSHRSNQSPQFNSSALGLVRGSFLCFFVALVAWLAFFFLSFLFSKPCK
jgi:hypothetical protein